MEDNQVQLVTIARCGGRVGVLGKAGPTGLGWAHAGIDAQQFVAVGKRLHADGRFECHTVSFARFCEVQGWPWRHEKFSGDHARL